MNRKLLNALAVAALAAVGVGTVMLAGSDAEAVRPELADAGVTEECEVLRLRSKVRDFCQTTRPDGGLSPRMRTIEDVLYRCQGPRGEEVKVPRYSADPVLKKCFEVLNPETDTIILGPDFDDGGRTVATVPDACTCRARGRNCRIDDGGTMDFARTYGPVQGPFIGAGCVPTPCEAAAGEPDSALADDCR